MFTDDYKVKVKEGKLFVQGKEISTDYPVANAFQEDNKIIVLFDPDSKLEKFGQFPNLIAINAHGQTVWRAELPTTTSGDCYYQTSSKNPLIADSIYSYRCDIDLQTGKIKRKEFLK